MDTVDWSQDIFNEIKSKMTPFINKCKFKTVTFIPISGYQGVGLTDTLNMPDWYKGSSLMDTISELASTDQIRDIVPISIPEFSSMIAEIRVLWVPKLISNGFECMIHYCGTQYPAIIKKIVSGSKHADYITEGEKVTVVIDSLNNRFKHENSTRRFIIRSCDNNTIGFGDIIKVKL